MITLTVIALSGFHCLSLNFKRHDGKGVAKTTTNKLATFNGCFEFFFVVVEYREKNSAVESKGDNPIINFNTKVFLLDRLQN